MEQLLWNVLYFKKTLLWEFCLNIVSRGFCPSFRKFSIIELLQVQVWWISLVIYCNTDLANQKWTLVFCTKKFRVFEAIWFRNFNKVREQEKKIILMRIRYTNAYVFHATSCWECNLWLVCQLGAWDMWVHSLILFFHISWVLPFNF